jgi:hypothetical protein
LTIPFDGDLDVATVRCENQLADFGIFHVLGRLAVRFQVKFAKRNPRHAAEMGNALFTGSEIP